MWAERTRLRTEELQGIIKAIEILSGGEETFKNATTTFVQTRSVRNVVVRSHSSSGMALALDKAYKSLSSHAKQYGSLRLAKLAAQVSTGGHFDKVIAAITKMVEVLRVEEQEDIKHRDRCQRSENKNGNEIEDLDSDIKKKGAEIERLDKKASDTKDAIAKTEEQMKETEADMKELLEMRNKDHAEFKQALKDDSDSIDLIGEAIVSLSKFYKKNKIPLALQQEEPEYTVDPDKAPETTWDGGEYGGRKSENEGIISILSMLKEDLEKEMKEGREADAAEQEAYLKDNGALTDTLEAQGKSKSAAEKELQDIEEKTGDTEEEKKASEGDLAAEDEMKGALETDCAWVKTHFESRAKKRKVEMDGLVEAKDYLAGARPEDDIE